MPKKKRKRPFFDFFGFGEENFLFEREPVKGGSGYSIYGTYDEKSKPLFQVKTYGYVDAAELRKDIKQRYPGARIEGLEKKPRLGYWMKRRRKRKTATRKVFNRV